MNMELKKQFLTTGEIAKRCGVSFRTVIRWIEKGYLLAQRLPGRGDYRISELDFTTFLTANNLKVNQVVNAVPAVMTQNFTHKALIVDDDFLMARSIERTFRNLKYETMVAHDGVQVGYLLHKFQPTVMTLDLKMKFVDGFEVLKWIREQNELVSCKIIVISGASQEDMKRAHSEGADAALSKPFSRVELEQLLRRIENE